ncbi:MAG: hypothetical protein ACN4G0_14240 [Polyangiales bacterium]
MTDLDLLIAGAMVSFITAAGAYIAIRRRANESPVSAYEHRDLGQAAPAANQPRIELR